MIPAAIAWGIFLLWSLRVGTSVETPPLLLAWRVFLSALSMGLLLWDHSSAFVVLNCLIVAGQVGQVGALLLVAPPPEQVSDLGAALVMGALRLTAAVAIWGVM